ncbi:hypothetical protein Tco_0457436, partial [Tanacetum coccineum]
VETAETSYYQQKEISQQKHETTSTNQFSSINVSSRKSQPTAETMQTAGTHTLPAEMNPTAEVCQ